MSVSTFFKGIRTEMKHVVWPTKAQTTASVIFVVVASFLVAYYLGLLDAVFQALLKFVLNR